MERKSLLAALAAATFALPLSAGATGAEKSAAGSAPASTASTTAGKDGGAQAMFAAIDKNGDGFISKDEAKGTPHGADFAKLDTNGDGKLSPEEHAAAPEHSAQLSATMPSGGSSAGSADASGGKKAY